MIRFLANLFPYLALLLLPFALLDIRLPVPGLQVRISDFYLLGLTGCFLIAYRDALPWLVKCIGPFVPFIAYIILHSIITGKPGNAVESVQWILVLLWVPLFSYAMKNGDDRILKALLLSLAFVAVYVAVSHIMMGQMTRYKYMGDAKYAFGLFALLAFLSLARYGGILRLLLLVIAIILSVLSKERTGAVVSVASLLLIFPLLMLGVGNLLVSSVLFGAKLVVLCSGFIVFSLLTDNLSIRYYLDEESARWESDLHRSNLINNGVEIYLNNPIFGVGARELNVHMRDYYIDDRLALYTHNFYLDFWVEYGLVGVLLFFVPVFMSIFSVNVRHSSAKLLLPLVFYCFAAPTFMANGTTTMLIYLTGLAILIALQPARVQIAESVPTGQVAGISRV